MKNKIIILMSMLLLIIPMSQAVNTCFNSTANITICYTSNSGIYPQNIDLWEGANDKYGLYITNPDDDNNYNLLVRTVKNAFDSGKIDITKLGDETTFEFQSIDDFYNLIQQNNALGNVTLFTTAELNQEMREQNILLTAQVIQWTITLFIVIMELLKITLSVVVIIASIYIFFRLIPFALKKINVMMFRFVVGKKR